MGGTQSHSPLQLQPQSFGANEVSCDQSHAHQEIFPLRQGKQLFTVLYLWPKTLSQHNSHSMNTQQNRVKNIKRTTSQLSVGLRQRELISVYFYVLPSPSYSSLPDSLITGGLERARKARRTFLNQGQLAGTSDGKKINFRLLDQVNKNMAGPPLVVGSVSYREHKF